MSALLSNGDIVIVWNAIDDRDAELGIWGTINDRYGNKRIDHEFHVNTFIPNSQSINSILPLPDGFQVTWHGWSEFDTSGILAQRFTLLGEKVGAEIGVNKTKFDNQYHSKAILMENGRILIIWISVHDSSFGKVYYQIFEPDMTLYGLETQFDIGYVSKNKVAYVNIIKTVDGGFLLAYNSADSQDVELGFFIQKYNSSVRKSGIAIRIHLDAGRGEIPPDTPIVVESAKGVGWSGPGRCTCPGTIPAEYANYQVGADIGSECQGFENSCINGTIDKDNCVIFTDIAEIQVFSYRKLICGSPGYPEVGARAILNHDAAVLSNGDIVIVFDYPESDVYLQRIDLNGSLINSVTKVNSYIETDPVISPHVYEYNGQRNAKVVPYADGGFWVVWWYYNNGGDLRYRLYGQRYTQLGLKIGNEFPVGNSGYLSIDNKYRYWGLNCQDKRRVFMTYSIDGSVDGNGWGIFGLMMEGTNPTGIVLLNEKKINPANAQILNQNFIIGNQSGIDPNPVDTFFYKFSVGVGADNNNLFRIQSNDLIFTGDYLYSETTTYYYIRLRALDEQGEFFESAIRITVGSEPTETQAFINHKQVSSDVGGMGKLLNQKMIQLANNDIVLCYSDYDQTDGDGLGILCTVLDNVSLEEKVPIFVCNFDKQFNQNNAFLLKLPDNYWIAFWQGFGNMDAYGIYAIKYENQFYIGQSQFIVNNFRTNTQRNVHAAIVKGDPDFIVAVWESQDQDGDGYGIYAINLDFNLGKLNSEYKVNENFFKNQMNPRIVGLTNSNFVIVWESEDQTDNNLVGIWAKIYNNLTIPICWDFNVNTHQNGNQVALQIAPLHFGKFVIVWQSDSDQDGDKTGIFQQAYNSDCTRLGIETQVNTITTGEQKVPSLITLPNGDWWVTWYSEITNNVNLENRYDLMGQRYYSTGAKWLENFTIEQDALHKDNLEPISLLTVSDKSKLMLYFPMGVTGYGKKLYLKQYHAEVPYDITISNYSDIPNVQAGLIEDFLIGQMATSHSNSAYTEKNFTYTFYMKFDDIANNQLFKISNHNILYFKGDPNYDPQSTAQYKIYIRVTDPNSGFLDKELSIRIYASNLPPRDLFFAPVNVLKVPEAIAPFVMGEFSTYDININETFTYTLLEGEQYFTITDNKLNFKDGSTYYLQKAYSYRVRTTDHGGLSFEKSFDLTVQPKKIKNYAFQYGVPLPFIQLTFSCYFSNIIGKVLTENNDANNSTGLVANDTNGGRNLESATNGLTTIPNKFIVTGIRDYRGYDKNYTIRSYIMNDDLSAVMLIDIDDLPEKFIGDIVISFDGTKQYETGLQKSEANFQNSEVTILGFDMKTIKSSLEIPEISISKISEAMINICVSNIKNTNQFGPFEITDYLTLNFADRPEWSIVDNTLFSVNKTVVNNTNICIQCAIDYNESILPFRNESLLIILQYINTEGVLISQTATERISVYFESVEQPASFENIGSYITLVSIILFYSGFIHTFLFQAGGEMLNIIGIFLLFSLFDVRYTNEITGSLKMFVFWGYDSVMVNFWGSTASSMQFEPTNYEFKHVKSQILFQGWTIIIRILTKITLLHYFVIYHKKVYITEEDKKVKVDKKGMGIQIFQKKISDKIQLQRREAFQIHPEDVEKLNINLESEANQILSPTNKIESPPKLDQNPSLEKKDQNPPPEKNKEEKAEEKKPDKAKQTSDQKIKSIIDAVYRWWLFYSFGIHQFELERTLVQIFECCGRTKYYQDNVMFNFEFCWVTLEIAMIIIVQSWLYSHATKLKAKSAKLALEEEFERKQKNIEEQEQLENPNAKKPKQSKKKKEKPKSDKTLLREDVLRYCFRIHNQDIKYQPMIVEDNIFYIIITTLCFMFMKYPTQMFSFMSCLIQYRIFLSFRRDDITLSLKSFRVQNGFLFLGIIACFVIIYRYTEKDVFIPQNIQYSSIGVKYMVQICFACKFIEIILMTINEYNRLKFQKGKKKDVTLREFNEDSLFKHNNKRIFTLYDDPLRKDLGDMESKKNIELKESNERRKTLRGLFSGLGKSEKTENNETEGNQSPSSGLLQILRKRNSKGVDGSKDSGPLRNGSTNPPQLSKFSGQLKKLKLVGAPDKSEEKKWNLWESSDNHNDDFNKTGDITRNLDDFSGDRKKSSQKGIKGETQMNPEKFNMLANHLKHTGRDSHGNNIEKNMNKIQPLSDFNKKTPENNNETQSGDQTDILLEAPMIKKSTFKNKGGGRASRGYGRGIEPPKTNKIDVRKPADDTNWKQPNDGNELEIADDTNWKQPNNGGDLEQLEKNQKNQEKPDSGDDDIQESHQEFLN